MAYGQVRETSTVQLSGQTKGMREGIDSGLPRANFPRKISKEDLRTTAVRKICEGELKKSEKSRDDSTITPRFKPFSVLSPSYLD